MSIRTLATASLLALSALCAAGAATNPPSDEPPQQGGLRGERHGPPVSLDRFAMENALAERLGQQTGRPVAEIAAMLGRQPPPEVARTLGVDEATMKSLFEAARQSVIAKAQEAQLITAAQAEQLKSAPPPGRRPPMGGDPRAERPSDQDR